MKTPASVAGHPIHPMLITIPVGLWIFSLACDIIAFWARDSTVWHLVSFYSMAGGVVGALVAIIPGLIDMASMKDPHIKRIALWHMGVNVVVIVAFAINTGLRAATSEPPIFAVVLSFIGVVLLGFSGWLGAEMVHVHRVGVLEISPTTAEPGTSKGTGADKPAQRPPEGKTPRRFSF
ncbi:MAG: DUF2231 domain-containing protein [Pseudomonadota bacterium]